MAALGDSITRGFDACGWFQDCVRRSWAAGDEAVVNSHYLRITAKNPAMAGHAHNDARSGAKIADLDEQARTAVSQHVQYVTILMGANDACTSTESAMTPVSTFETRFRTAMASLTAGLPSADVLVLSIPDLKRLWYIGKGNWAARQIWNAGRICQSMLARPTSAAAADTARRDRVRQRVTEYNQALKRVCGQYPRCRYDGGALFGYRFTLSQISTGDRRLSCTHAAAGGRNVAAGRRHASGSCRHPEARAWRPPSGRADPR
jgi:lysophospholipase L1-like esterase